VREFDLMAGIGPPPKLVKHRQRGRVLGSGAHSALLPASGYRGRIPTWPLEGQSEREKVLWKRLWRTPQAVMWAQQAWPDVVARCARVLAEAERPHALGPVRNEARQLEDRLGLSPRAIALLRWAVADEEPEEPRQAPDVRQRLRVMDRQGGDS